VVGGPLSPRAGGRGGGGGGGGGKEKERKSERAREPESERAREPEFKVYVCGSIFGNNSDELYRQWLNVIEHHDFV
jgi:hypothetical protein